MLSHLLVLHFGAQCPWQPWAVEQARRAAVQLGGTLRVADVARQPELAERFRLFFPFMTIVDGNIRLPSPTPARELVRVATEGLTVAPARVTSCEPDGEADTVVPLTAANVADTCGLCIQPGEVQGCRAKAAWAGGIARQVPGGILGFVAYQDRQAVGAVEFLPAPLVPYPLPEKEPGTAFITCTYSTEEGPDYRGQVLERLIRHLEGADYRELQVIAGQRTPYPNGPEAFFRRHGFERVDEVDRVTLQEGEEVLVLLRRRLWTE